MKFKALFRKAQDVAPMRKNVAPAMLALSVSLVAAVPTTAQASILVSEPFDYAPGNYAGGSWGALSGSGVGWGSNVFFDHASTASNFVIGASGPAGTYFESQGQNLFGNYYRNRVMSPAIHTNNAGSVLWQSMLFWSDGSNNGGGMVVHNASGGTNYNICLANGNVYELRGGHNNTNGTTDADVSTITASTNPSAPDFLLFKIVNSSKGSVKGVSPNNRTLTIVMRYGV